MIEGLGGNVFRKPIPQNGYMSVNEVPGLGVDINEKEAAKYPIVTKSNWHYEKWT